MDGFTVNTLSEMVYSILGGRLPDVARFVYRVSSTRKRPLRVLQEMENEAQSDILNRAFGKKLFSPTSTGAWTQPQAWKCIKAIATAKEYFVPMDQAVLSIFKGDRTALQGLLATGVIRVEEGPKGELNLVAGSPLFLNTFKQMLYNSILRKGMEQMVLDVEYNDYTTEALKLEEDLSKVGLV